MFSAVSWWGGKQGSTGTSLSHAGFKSTPLPHVAVAASRIALSHPFPAHWHGDVSTGAAASLPPCSSSGPCLYQLGLQSIKFLMTQRTGHSGEVMLESRRAFNLI